MMSDLVESAVERFRLVVDGPETHSASGSVAGVYAARTAAGRDVYLKVTPAALGARALAAARRELSFYREVAPSLPVRSPGLLGAVDDGRGVVLLLAAAGESRGVAFWTETMWADLGRALAALHSVPPSGGEEWRRPDSLLEALGAPGLAAVTAFWEPVLPRLAEVVSRRGELVEVSGSLPVALVHGDWHTDNIVHVGGEPVFCDWQEAVVGRPMTDLAFLSVRATPAGVAVPSALLDAYVETSSLDRGWVERALLAEELAMFVFLRPGYAGFIDAAGTDRVRQRGRALADQYCSAHRRRMTSDLLGDCDRGTGRRRRRCPGRSGEPSGMQRDKQPPHPSRDLGCRTGYQPVHPLGQDARERAGHCRGDQLGFGRPGECSFGAASFAEVAVQHQPERAAATRVQERGVEGAMLVQLPEERLKGRRWRVRIRDPTPGVQRIDALPYDVRARGDREFSQIGVVEVERGSPDSRAPHDVGDADVAQPLFGAGLKQRRAEPGSRSRGAGILDTAHRANSTAARASAPGRACATRMRRFAVAAP